MADSGDAPLTIPAPTRIAKAINVSVGLWPEEVGKSAPSALDRFPIQRRVEPRSAA